MFISNAFSFDKWANTCLLVTAKGTASTKQRKTQGGGKKIYTVKKKGKVNS